MRSIDFTHAGGFPLTQNELDYLQSAYTECISALASLGGNPSIPAIISGMVKTTSGSAVTVTDGWFYYNGAMVKFTGGTVTPSGSDVLLVMITNNTTSLTYNDGSIYPAISNITATLSSGPSSTTADHFPYSIMQPYQYFFGLGGRESSWNSMSVFTSAANGGVTGTIYYKKNWLTNTLTLQGALTANNAQNFAASPAALFSTMGTLPAGYTPTTSAYFTTYFYASSLFKDDAGVAWVKQLTSTVNTTGQILINFLRPESVIPAYSVVFNTIIPLD